MWKLPHNCLYLALKQGTLEGIAVNTRGVPETRTTDRQAGFRRGRGSRDRIVNIRLMMNEPDNTSKISICVSFTTRRRSTVLDKWEGGFIMGGRVVTN